MSALLAGNHACESHVHARKGTQYDSKIRIKNSLHKAAPTAESHSLVSHLFMDDLIIGAFTHPYTSNNTVLYAKTGCAIKKEAQKSS